MIICISGLSGSGKNSVGELVAKKLGLRIVNPTFKTIAEKEHISLMEFHKKAEQEHSIDKEFDARLIEETKRGDCVVTTWLGPWMVKKADMKVWLYAPKGARAERVAGRDGMDFEAAEKHITERDESNHIRYHEIYRINIYDHSGFDLVINTDKFMPEESSEIITAAACAKRHEVGGKNTDHRVAGKCMCACHMKEKKVAVPKKITKKKIKGKKKKR